MQVKLSDAELEAFLAEKVMGWEIVEESKYYFSEGKEVLYLYQWHPLEDRNQLQLCLEKVGEILKGTDVFCCLLENITGKKTSNNSVFNMDEFFLTMTASPRAIAEAIYLTLEGE